MKARVIVTLDCNRNCKGCCNKTKVIDDHIVLKDIQRLMEYEEIIITGGEPMLTPDKVDQFIETIIDFGYVGKIYMHTAFVPLSKSMEIDGIDPMFSRVFRQIDGIIFTLHDNATREDIKRLKVLSESNLMRNTKGSHWLSIDTRVYDEYDLRNIDFGNWTGIKKLQWKEYCPLPENEQLFIYEL